ncbi:MAG: flagellar biosynthetic protein FliR, partial [Gammaproteobacteria bacterium]|nr:flagellar biosynthetic protein FliR [Gammaproteobacteria bacterium]
MPEFTYAEIMLAANRFMLPFFRISSFIMVVPIFGSNLVNVRARLMISLVVTLAVVGQIQEVPQYDAVSLQSIPIIFKQIAIGVALGF